MGARKLREPLLLRQRDTNDCMTCVVAQILWMFGKTDQPDVRRLHKQLGGKRGQGVSESEAELYLLQHGFHTHGFCKWSNDAFIRQGLPYLHAYYGDRWTPELQAYFTPELVAEQQQVKREAIQRVGGFGSRHQHTSRTATASDIAYLLNNGYVLMLSLKLEDLERHAVLLCDIHPRRRLEFTLGAPPYVTMYYPATRPSFLEFALEDIPRQLPVEDGVTAVRL